MRKLLIVILLFVATNLGAQNYEPISLLFPEVNKLIHKGLPKSAIAELERIVVKSRSENNQHDLTVAQLMRYKLIISNGFYESPDQVMRSMDSLRRRLNSPYRNAVAVAMMEAYKDFSKQQQTSSSTINHCDSIPVEQWSRENYEQKYQQLTKLALSDAAELSALRAVLLSPMLNYTGDNPQLSALEVIGNRLFELDQTPKIYNTLVASYTKYQKTESLFLLKLHQMFRTERNSDKRVSMMKELMDQAPKTDYMDAELNIAYAVELFNAGQYSEVMRLYADNPKYNNDKIICGIIKTIKSTVTELTYEPIVSPYPGKNWLCKLFVRNGKVLRFTAYPVSVIDFNNYQLSKLDSITRHITPVLKWNQNLPKKTDYLERRYAVEMPPLNSGRYVIKIESEGIYENVVRWMRVAVTDMTIVRLPLKNQVMVVDRNSGKPLPYFEIKAYNEREEHLNVLKTNDKGVCDYSVIFENPRARSWCKLIATKGRSSAELIVDEFSMRNRELHIVDIFVDRPIYRPGQKVKFDLVNFKIESTKSNVMTDKEVEVKLVNDEKTITSVKLKLNEFGSASGEFLIPRNIVGGNLEIVCGNDRTSFEVSEYKRPETEIILDPLNKFYPQNSTIAVTGKVLTMNGVPIVGAKINYKIGIVEGAALFTDVNGAFSIPVNMKDYSVEVNIISTSPSGHTANAVILLYNDAVLNISVTKDEQYPMSIPKVEVTNSQDQVIDVPMNVVIYRDKSKLLRDDYADSEILMKKQDFERKFPEYLYKDEKTQEKIEVVYRGNFPSVDSLNVMLLRFKLASGRYQMELVSPKSLMDSTVENFMIINPESTKTLESLEPYVYYKEKQYVAGDTLKLILGTNRKDEIFYIYKQNVKGSAFLKTVTLSNCQRVIDIPITEDDQPEMMVYLLSQKNECFWDEAFRIRVQGRDNRLKIETTSMRDKITPGARERWSFKITDNKGMPADAEVLAYMYDASLDNLAGSNSAIHQQIFSEYYSAFDPYRIDVSNNQVYQVRQLNYNLSFSIFPLKSLMTPFGVSNFSRRESNMVSSTRSSAQNIVETVDYGGTAEGVSADDVSASKMLPPSAIRTNFDERAIFMPDLRTDAQGIVTVDFTAPGTMTRWNAGLIAHTKDMKTGYLRFNVVTAKELMVTVNKPRYLRDGDQIVLSARVDNRTDKAMECTPKMILTSLENDTPLSDLLIMDLPQEKITIPAQGSQTISWRVKTPNDYTGALVCEISVRGGTHTDGERIEVAVIDNRDLVTETVPIILPSGKRADYSLNIRNDDGRENLSVRLELTTNPLWTVLEVLPVVANEHSDLNTNIFNAYYANMLANYLKSSYKSQFAECEVNARRSIQGSAEAWNSTPLLSHNDLKQIALEATPWLAEAGNQQQRAEVTVAFFKNPQGESSNRLRDLFENQNSDGSFSWVGRNMMFDRLTSLYIATGFGRLVDLGVQDFNSFKYKTQLINLVKYLDADFAKSSQKSTRMYDYYYMYMRSKFDDIPRSPEASAKFEKVLTDAKSLWINESIYLRAMIGSVFLSSGDVTTAKAIAESLVETAYVAKNGAMSWRQQWGYSWYLRPVETHTAVLELLARLDPQKYQKSINGLKMWMLINKHGNSWGYSTATTDACYALLLNAQSSLNRTPQVRVFNADKQLDLISEQVGFKPNNVVGKTWEAAAVNSKLDQFKVDASRDEGVVVLGTLYYQYIQNRDKINASKSLLTLDRKFYVVGEGGALIETSEVKLGDRVKVRLVVEAKEDVEYVHLRDNRSVGFEPLVQVAEYKWDNGLGYYKTIRDTATDFFIRELPRGVHIIEYDVVATYKGDMSSGYAEIQSLYAPEFKATTPGTRVVVK